MPKISIIMPLYNSARFLAQAIESVLAQSYPNWELIIIDDGSTDSSPSILEQFDDPRIHVYRQANAGEAGARNNGLSKAAGEYIAFLDADDYYFPNALADLVSFLDQHPECSVVYSNGHICDHQSQFIMTLSDIRSGIYKGNVLEEVVISSSVVTVPNCTMTRHAAISKYGIQFDRNLVIGPDWDFWIQLAVHVGFGYLDKVTCAYRVHQTNITRTIDSKKRQRDKIFGRMKVMQSDWFADLSLITRERFFSDLLINIAGGEAEALHDILNHQQFIALPARSRAHLLRMVGIKSLQNDRDVDLARSYLTSSFRLEPENRKTRFLLSSLKKGPRFTLVLVSLWRFAQRLITRGAFLNKTRSRRLQKLFGHQ